MRIKCPNSDVFLELPGDRTDMKFTCPACHKVHRVTISITTPGEDPPPPPAANTRTMTRSQPPMPKKYATGAYAPVVDIPIDANFVLVDENAPRQQGQGIDLGHAAEPPPYMDRDLSNRKTEIVGDRRPDSEKMKKPEPPPPPPKPEEPADNGPYPSETEAKSAEKARFMEDDTNLANPESRTADSEETAKDDPAEHPEEPPRREQNAESAKKESPRDRVPPRPRRASRERERDSDGRGGGRGVLVLLILAALAVAGFLGWQQYLYENNRKNADTYLAWADTAWKNGEITASASAARDAEATLKKGDDFLTARNLWNRLAAATGLFAPRPSGNEEAERKIDTYLQREKKFNSFLDDLDPSSARAMAAQVRHAAVEADLRGDKPLVGAMERAAVAKAMDGLRSRAELAAPEESTAMATEDWRALSPVLADPARTLFEEELAAFADAQRRRLLDAVREEIAGIGLDAAAGSTGALTRYRRLHRRLENSGDDPELSKPLADLAPEADSRAFRQLARLNDLVNQAAHAARTILSRAEDEDETAMDSLARRAQADTSPHPAMAEAAVRLIDNARAEADDLLRLRAEVFGRMQAEMKRGRNNPGTRLAWAMLRMGFEDPDLEIDPAAFRFDADRAAMEFTFKGLPASMTMNGEDYERNVRAVVDGYAFASGWAVLFRKPVSWMAAMAGEMRKAGVNPAEHPRWELLEGPGGPLALSQPGTDSELALASVEAGGESRQVFFKGGLRTVTELPQNGDWRVLAGDFRRAAELLHDGVMADESIPQPIRQALKPVLMGAYQKPDPRDYFDSAFCRRLIEADYLETYIHPMPPERQRELDTYRRLLGRLEAGYDEFAFELDDGSRVVAVARMDADFSGDGRSSDQDPDTGEGIPRYTWRVETADDTVFHSPMPSRFYYAFMLAEHYPGRHRVRPPGRPELTEVWHATQGKIASYVSGADKATGSETLWDLAIAEDSSGRYDPSIGPPGWNFPLHVLERDDQDDPLVLATLTGTVASPDFSGIADTAERRRAEDAWLDSTAATLSTPGELGLIFHQFFRYCSDSPLPQYPNLIGSHFGLSDTHQTVYESLERRWVGRLIGDCDDLAEFFQVLTSRQGKLSHVMQLPGHAACGYVERGDSGEYRFIVLQTGPVLQFTAPSLNEVVETAYRSFDRGEGISHMTPDAVPLLLRFADEETRTPFVLSARIYEDREYAETMIRVQAYWHEHVYSAALKVMEELVKTDQEIGNIKELGSLYERVGFYDKSEEWRRRELELVADNPQAAISTLLEIVQLHFQDKNRDKALAALGEMEAIMVDMIRRDDAQGFFTAMTFRSYWAMYLSRLGQPARAWNLVKYDVSMTKRQLGRIADPVLRTLGVMYDRMSMQRNAGTAPTPAERQAVDEVRRELEEAFGRGYFKADDAYNNIITRYFVLGRFAVADAGRAAGLDRLLRDGPYPSEAKDQTRRARGLEEDDWKWFRITPQLFLSLGMEMLDPEEYPELFDPVAAKPLLENVARAVIMGTGLGSDVAGGDDVIKADLTLSFLNRDLAAFRRSMGVVKEKDYSSLYDDAALTFGLHGGLVPLSEFPAWIEAFREFFPGSQHYFKVVYRAIDKENYDHALLMAEATARFFPDDAMLRREAEFVRGIIPGLKERKVNREIRQSRERQGTVVEMKPAA